jgi:ABC-type multidrug transport system fused ATPase/permease subunit
VFSPYLRYHLFPVDEEKGNILRKLVRLGSENSLSLALSVLEPRDRRLIYVVVLIQIFLGGLDLLGVLTIGLIGSLAVTGLSAQSPGNRVNSILNFLGLGNETLQTQVAVMGILAATVLIIKTFLTMYFSRRVLFFLARRGAVISSNLIKRYFSRPITTLHIRSTQESIYALTHGVNAVMVGLIGAWISLIADLTLLSILAVGLLAVDITTTFVTFALFSLTAYVLHYLMHERIQNLGTAQAKLSIVSNEKISEAIQSYRELIVRNRRGYYAREIASSRYKLAEGSASIAFMQNLNKYVLEIAMVVTSLVLAAYQFSNQSASRAVAVVAIFIGASARITPAVLRVQQGLLSIRAQIGSAKPTVELISEIRFLQPIADDATGFPVNHKGFTGRVDIENVSFAYTKGVNVLEDVSLDIAPGEFVGIVGESGAGKTTLVDVLLGAIEPDKGSIRISALPPLETYSKWPGAVSYIPQDISIINGTIRENICLGYPTNEVPDDICWESLRVAQLEELVRSFSEGLDHYVGDRGTRLSGGQRQRLGIARALITKPKMLILDEATSALDGITEAEISESLRRLKGETTLVVIAHRLSTVLEADRVIFMEEGKVIDSGKFDELKARVPRFKEQAAAMGL